MNRLWALVRYERQSPVLWATNGQGCSEPVRAVDNVIPYRAIQGRARAYYTGVRSGYYTGVRSGTELRLEYEYPSDIPVRYKCYLKTV